MTTDATAFGSSGAANPIPTRNALLYWVGSGLWLAFSAASSLTYPFATSTGQATALGILQATCFALTFFSIGLLDHTRSPFKRYTLVGLSALACGIALVVALANSVLKIGPLLYVASVVLAVGRASGFCQWLRLLQAFGLRQAKWTLVMGSAVEIALTFFLAYIVPESLRASVVFGLYAPLGLVLLALNVRVNGMSDNDLDQLMAARSGTINQQMTSKKPQRRIRHELLLPVVCAMALTLITPIANTVFGGAGRSGSPNELIVPLSHAFSLVLLSVLWFAAKRDITLPRLYCVFLPILASIVFIYSLVGASMSPVVLFIGNCGYFFVSLLMVTTCLDVAEQHGVRALPLYCLFAGFVYLTDATQLALDGLVADGLLNMEPYVVAMLLLYVLMIPAFFIVTPFLGKRMQGDIENSQPAPRDPETPQMNSQPGHDDTFASIAAANNLSPRQTEVMRCLASGRNVDHIAASLHLSPNTVRSYRKQLYATLGIHGLQELLDLVEQASKRE